MKKSLRFTKPSITFCCFLVILLFFTNVKADTIINVKADKECSVAGEKINFSDIASITGVDENIRNKVKNIELGFSPYIGMSRNIDLEEIKVRLKQNGVPLEQVNLDIPEKITVTREYQTLESKEIEHRVRNFFNNKYASSHGIRLKRVRGAKNIILPSGTITTEIEIVRTSLSGNNYSILFTTFVNGGKAAFLQLSADIEKTENTIISKQKIFRNQIITEDDVVQIRKITDFRAKNNFSEIEDVIGKKATRLIDVNKPITADMVAEIPLLEKGDRVSIRVSSDGLIISALGEVLSNGYIGESVKVRNIDSGKIIRAIVLSKQEVKVDI